jgi:succinoglycan biosynthesis transport protein ExoP
VLPVADALQVAQHVDAVLYSVLRDVSRLPALQAAHERLAAVGIRPLGAIVSGTASEFYGHHYYAYASSRSSESA